MNRTTLAYRVAILSAGGMLIVACLQTATAAEQPSPSKPAAAQPATSKIESAGAPAIVSALPTTPKVRFQFRNQPWKDVLEWFVREVDLSLVDGSLPGTFNYSDNREYTPAEAFDVLNEVLLTKGFLLVRHGPMLMLINLRAAGIKEIAVGGGTWSAHAPTTSPELVGGRPAPEAKNFIASYQTRYVDPMTAGTVLGNIIANGDAGRLSIDRANNRIIVFGPRKTHDMVKDLLETLDVPPAAERESQIKIFTLVHVDPASASRMLYAILPKGIQVAVDERTHSLIASGPPESLNVAEALLLRLDQSAEKERPKSDLRYEVRVVWLANDDKASPLAEDLKDVAGELSRMGIKNPRQIGEMVVRNISAGHFQIESSPLFKGEAAGFSATGTLSVERDGPPTLQIAIKTTARPSGPSAGQPQSLNSLDTQIVAPQKQYVVLATAPVGNITSAFVVQVASSTKPVEAK